MTSRSLKKKKKGSTTIRSRNQTPRSGSAKDLFGQTDASSRSPRWKKQTVTPTPDFFAQQRLIPKKGRMPINGMKLVNVFKMSEELLQRNPIEAP